MMYIDSRVQDYLVISRDGSGYEWVFPIYNAGDKP